MAGMQPKVSCIIPTMNRQAMLEKALNSALNQTHENIEIIVVDDSGARTSEPVVNKYDGRVKYFANQENQGACYCRNKGIKESTGDFVAFLDDDDVWLPNKIEEQLSVVSQSPIVGCNYLEDNGSNKIKRIMLPFEVSFKQMLTFNYLGSCSFVMIDRNALKGCWFDEELSCAQDWDMWLGIMKKNKISRALCAQKYLVNYNRGQHSRISTKSNKCEQILKVYNKYQKCYGIREAKMLMAHINGVKSNSKLSALSGYLRMARYSGNPAKALLTHLYYRSRGVVKIL